MRAVEAGDRCTAISEKLREHLLCGYKLGEDKQLHIRIAFLLLKLVNPFKQGLRLGIRATGLHFPRCGQKQLHFGALVFQRRESRPKKCIRAGPGHPARSTPPRPSKAAV